ncbi:MAG: hypothetical protein QMB92_10500 [Thiopseudomonas sp.]|nr:hypothetical protein [Gammaproteobacteria bacterium]
MRIDGFSPAYVPNRTTRSDAIEASDALLRQDESRSRQGEQLSQNGRPQSLQAVSQLQAQAEYQRYQEHKAEFAAPQVPWQNQQAMASYATAASFAGDDPVDAAQVLGLDLYA